MQARDVICIEPVPGEECAFTFAYKPFTHWKRWGFLNDKKALGQKLQPHLLAPPGVAAPMNTAVDRPQDIAVETPVC